MQGVGNLAERLVKNLARRELKERQSLKDKLDVLVIEKRGLELALESLEGDIQSLYVR